VDISGINQVLGTIILGCTPGEDMLKANKIRLYPNKEQKQIISSQIGGARYIFNLKRV
jgi:hypothetical protein